MKAAVCEYSDWIYIEQMPCPERNISAGVPPTGEDGEHVPIDMELTCTAPLDDTVAEEVTGSN